MILTLGVSTRLVPSHWVADRVAAGWQGWPAYRVELFDTISLTLARYGWSAKTFMVLGREWSGLLATVGASGCGRHTGCRPSPLGWGA